MKLYNAHRLVQLRTFPPKEILRAVPVEQRWKYRVTPDVVRFAEESGLHEDPSRAHQFKRLIHNPELYFSRPENVPLMMRQQVYFPEVVLTLIRTPHLPPRFASFWVPLWFNKLDMKDYLQQVYDVEVLHVRSYVQLQKVYREQIPKKGKSAVGIGALKRPASKKKMTVQLAEEFVWPEEVEDYSPWERESFHETMKERENIQNNNANSGKEAPKKHLSSIAEQAKALLQGKEKWKPTWQSVPVDKAAGRSDVQP